MPGTRTRSAVNTRAAILDAARRRFGQDGYERTTIRSVAADVGVDPALVMRYFGNKEGLFTEAADFDLGLPDLSGVPPEKLAEVLLPKFFAVWENQPTFLALLRASITSEKAATTMLAVFSGQVAPALAAIAVDHPVERAALVGSQILGLAVARYVIRVPPLTTMSHTQLQHWLGPTLRRYLTDPYPAPEQP